MQAVVSIIGRPNVGKSTLFNALTKSKQALVVDQPGTTRDRNFGQGKIGTRAYLLVDTGGLGFEEHLLDHKMAEQSLKAIDEADLVIFVVDGQAGVTAADKDLAKSLRQVKVPVVLCVNKTDGLDIDVAMSEFYSFGFKNIYPVSAKHKRGLNQFAENFLSHLPEVDVDPQAADIKGITIGIIGQPNVGKSTLTNRLLGEDRVIVMDQPGTTRDSIYIPFERDEQQYTLIDTAGVRRRKNVKETIEKFSVFKSLQAIEDSNVIVFLLDARRGIHEQDLTLLDFIIETGRCLIIAVNKWDGLSAEDKSKFKQTLQYKISFVNFAKLHFISALHGSGVGNLYESIHEAYTNSTKNLPTPMLTTLLSKAVDNHPPPMVHGRRIKLRYAHSGGHNPQRIIIHGNQTEHLAESYKRYLINYFHQKLDLRGAVIKVEFKTGDNPYQGKRNTLTPRQERKRKRMKKHLQKKHKK